MQATVPFLALRSSINRHPRKRLTTTCNILRFQPPTPKQTEYQIIDKFLAAPPPGVTAPTSGLRDEVMKIMPVQKQTSAGQRTRFKAFVAIGDYDGHVGLGVKCAKEVRAWLIAGSMDRWIDCWTDGQVSFEGSGSNRPHPS